MLKCRVLHQFELKSVEVMVALLCYVLIAHKSVNLAIESYWIFKIYLCAVLRV